MLSVEEAQAILINSIPEGPMERISLRKASKSVLAKEVSSPTDSPSFSNSAMDGYAIFHEETPNTFSVTKTIAAGETNIPALKSGEAIQIMTGAMIPEGATAVVPQENVELKEEGKVCIPKKIEKGEHIRLQGEEIRKGSIALKKWALLNPGSIGFLASLGVYDIDVYAKPKIAILTTGSELIHNKSQFQPGKIFESNSFSLQAAMDEFYISPNIFPPITDQKEVLKKSIEGALKEHDFILITGGVSVGKFDFAKEVLAELGVEEIFWRVSQKPGKPIYFGQREKTFVFGLPGNPASSLVCFYEYVRPAILKWMGYKTFLPIEETATLEEPYSKKGNRIHFVRAIATRSKSKLSVRSAGKQGSHRMEAFIQTNCLMLVPENKTTVNKGDEIVIHWI